MSDEHNIELEEKIAHLEHGIQALSETVYNQQRLLDQLADQYRTLVEQVKPLVQAAGSSAPGHEPPPHY